MSNIQADTLELSKKITAAVSIDKDSGIAKVEGDVFIENLPEGITEETIDTVSRYRTRFVAAGAHAFGNAALEALKANENLDACEGSFSMGKHDDVNFKFNRRTESRIPATGETVVKFGVLSRPIIETRSNRDSGDLKKIRAELATAGLAALKK